MEGKYPQRLENLACMHLCLGIRGGLFTGAPVYTQILESCSWPSHLCSACSQTPPAVNCKRSTQFHVWLVESVDAKLTDVEGRMYVH